MDGCCNSIVDVYISKLTAFFWLGRLHINFTTGFSWLKATQIVMIYVKMMFLPYFTPNTHYTQCALAIPVRMSMSSFSSSSIVTLSISIVSLWHAVGYCFRRCCTMLEMLLFQILKLKSIHLTFWESCSLYF